jgi:exosortase/archaeosortase family protein
MSKTGPASRLIRRGAVLRFVLWLTGLMVAFNAAFYLWLADSRFLEVYLSWNASASAWLLRIFGESATAAGTFVASPRFGLEIKDGCDALQPMAFFIFAMLASPVPVRLRSRLVPILVGTLALLLLNLVRILTLYYTGIYFPSAFEPMHIDVWQSVFIFLPLTFWLVWALRAMRPSGTTTHASS